MLPPRILVSTRYGGRLLGRSSCQWSIGRQQLRTHMNHGGGGGGDWRLPLESPGPRLAGVEIGLDSATSSHHILRLLENWQSTTHGRIIWEQDGDGWKPTVAEERRPGHRSGARLLDLSFSDFRTALAKVVGGDGRIRYLSLLQLEEFKPLNGGWMVLREVIGSGVGDVSANPFASLHRALERYLSIEHGGGRDDQRAAEGLFHPQSSLLAVGSDQLPGEWTAPVGSLLEIPLNTYLNGVLAQTKHDGEATRYDAILSMDVLPCGTAAAATVRVGNGARTRVFHDHLLLGCRTESTGEPEAFSWQILSKTFSPQAWPTNED